MKYENKEAFEQVNMFGTGTPNTAFSPYMTALRQAVRQESLEKIAREG